MSTPSMLQMEDQIERLRAHFVKQEPININEDVEEIGDDNLFGERWEVREPDHLQEWSIGLIPMTDKLHFLHKFKNAPDFLPISHEEQIIDVDVEDGVLLISCATTTDVPYQFTLMIDPKKSRFSISQFLRSLQNSNYERVMKVVEEEAEKGSFNVRDTPKAPRVMVSKLRGLLRSIEKETVENSKMSNRLKPIDGGRTFGSEFMGSQGSAPAPSSRNLATKATPAPTREKTRRQKRTPGSSSKRLEKTLVSEPEKSVADSVITDIPADRSAGKSTDFTTAKQMFESFWGECRGDFVFKVEETKSVNINQLDRAPGDWTIRSFDQAGVEATKHYLAHMADISKKQTICVMPQCDKKPTTWDEIKNGRFWIINGQHSVAAAIEMQSSGHSEEIVKAVQNWDAFVVWSEDPEHLRRISRYYNRCNHFSMFQPTWGTNVVGARYLWTSLGCPVPPKSATRVGQQVAKKNRYRKDLKNEQNYKVKSSSNKENHNMFSSMQPKCAIP